MGMPWKLQSILFSSFRGPDQEFLVKIKQVSKWMRFMTQYNADPSKPYMNDIQLPKVEELYKELEHCPCHFVHHFLDGLAIIAHYHPDRISAVYAAHVHYSCAEELFHFVPEFHDIFKLRHRDKINGEDPQQKEWDTHMEHTKDVWMNCALRRFEPESSPLL